MSSGNRFVLIGLAVAVLVVAVLVTSLGGGDDEEQAAAPTTQVTPTPPAATSNQPQARPAKTPKPKPTPEPALRVEVKGGEPVGGVQELEVDKGESARFTVVSDVDEEVHVHGYDYEKPVAPGKPAKFDFKADIDGILEVELENAGIEVLSLRVNP